MHQTAIKPQTKLETLRSSYTLVFQKSLTTALPHEIFPSIIVVISIVFGLGLLLYLGLYRYKDTCKY